MSARLRTALQGASVGRTVLLTNWVSVSGSSPVTTATQDESEWAELSDYADATFFIEVAQVSNPSGGLLLLYLESAPTRDESLFTASPIVGPIARTRSRRLPPLPSTKPGIMMLSPVPTNPRVERFATQIGRAHV